MCTNGLFSLAEVSDKNEERMTSADINNAVRNGNLLFPVQAQVPDSRRPWPVPRRVSVFQVVAYLISLK